MKLLGHQKSLLDACERVKRMRTDLNNNYVRWGLVAHLVPLLKETLHTLMHHIFFVDYYDPRYFKNVYCVLSALYFSCVNHIVLWLAVVCSICYV